MIKKIIDAISAIVAVLVIMFGSGTAVEYILNWLGGSYRQYPAVYTVATGALWAYLLVFLQRYFVEAAKKNEGKEPFKTDSTNKWHS